MPSLIGDISGDQTDFSQHLMLILQRLGHLVTCCITLQPFRPNNGEINIGC